MIGSPRAMATLRAIGALPASGVLRALGVAAAGAGLVLGATIWTGPVDLAQKTRLGSVTTSLAQPVTRVRTICPGPEALGIEGLPDTLAQTVSVSGVSAPIGSLPPAVAASLATGAGSLAVSELPSVGTGATPVLLRGEVLSSKIATASSALIEGAGAMAPGVVAAQRSWVREGDNRGLVTAACLPTAASSWLIAGGAEPGRRERLVLTNPGPNPVTVDLTVFGAKGPIQSPNGHGLIVGPNARLVVLLDAIAGSEPSPVVQVTAQGGEVAAVLNDTWLDGVVPRGGDDATPVAGPSREHVIAGVAIQGGAILRIAVPGNDEAVVESRVLTPSGPKALPAGGVTRLAAQSTKDIDLGTLPPDAYAVQVRADVPVVAAAMVDRRGAVDAPSDLAWSGASLPIRTLAGMALHGPEETGLVERLDLAATKNPATVLVTTVTDGKVTTSPVVIAPDSVFTFPLGGATSVWVTQQTGLVWAAVVTVAPDPLGELVSVTPLAGLLLTTTTLPLRELPH